MSFRKLVFMLYGGPTSIYYLELVRFIFSGYIIYEILLLNLIKLFILYSYNTLKYSVYYNLMILFEIIIKLF